MMTLVSGVALISLAVALNRADGAATDHATAEMDAIAVDARLYAKDHGVTQAEAERRVVAGQELGPYIAGIREVAPERHAGMWMYREGGFGIVVWFTGGPDVEIETRVAEITKDAPAPLEIRWGARFSLAQLREAQQKHSAELWQYEGASGLGIDEINNAVSFDLARDSKWATDPDGFAALREERFGVAFTVTLVDGPMVDQPYFGPIEETR